MGGSGEIPFTRSPKNPGEYRAMIEQILVKY
jgi:hypothetical protein